MPKGAFLDTVWPQEPAGHGPRSRRQPLLRAAGHREKRGCTRPAMDYGNPWRKTKETCQLIVDKSSRSLRQQLRIERLLRLFVRPEVVGGGGE